MRRLLTLVPAAVLACVGVPATAAAQIARPLPEPVTQLAAAAQIDVRGIVLDDRGEPVTGAVISALGSTTAFAVASVAALIDAASLTWASASRSIRV